MDTSPINKRTLERLAALAGNPAELATLNASDIMGEVFATLAPDSAGIYGPEIAVGHLVSHSVNMGDLTELSKALAMEGSTNENPAQADDWEYFSMEFEHIDPNGHVWGIYQNGTIWMVNYTLLNAWEQVEYIDIDDIDETPQTHNFWDEIGLC